MLIHSRSFSISVRGKTIFRPKKNWVSVEPRLKRSEETQERLEVAGCDVMDYDERWGRYRVRLGSGDISKHGELLSEFQIQRNYS